MVKPIPYLRFFYLLLLLLLYSSFTLIFKSFSSPLNLKTFFFLYFQIFFFFFLLPSSWRKTTNNNKHHKENVQKTLTLIFATPHLKNHDPQQIVKPFFFVSFSASNLETCKVITLFFLNNSLSLFFYPLSSLSLSLYSNTIQVLAPHAVFSCNPRSHFSSLSSPI